jgi:hypothetical protein
VLTTTAVIVALIQLFTSVGPVPLFFLGLALIALGLVVVQKLQKHRVRPKIGSSDLWAAVYGERQKERERRARQIAKEIVDREEKG